MIKKTSFAAITAQKSFTAAQGATTSQSGSGTDGLYLYGNFTLDIWGTFTATVTLQRSTDDGVTWRE